MWIVQGLNEVVTSRRKIGTSVLETNAVYNCLYAILSHNCKLSIYLDEREVTDICLTK